MTTAQIASLAGIGVLLALSAFFSGSETALTATSRPRMHHLEKRGNRRARMVGRLIHDRERLIGASLLGNHAVNILGSALATSGTPPTAAPWAVSVQVVGRTSRRDMRRSRRERRIVAVAGHRSHPCVMIWKSDTF